jgi:outer membrane lipoprotein LolB
VRFGLRAAGWVACGAVLAGCAGAPPPGSLAGRLSVQVDASGQRAAQSLSADFDLRGDARAGDLRLSTPLGTTLAEVRWSAAEAVLLTPQGEARHADLESLARSVFGEALPLQALPDWLRARPWPGAAHRALDAPQSGFEQLGWVVDTARAAEGRVAASRASPPAVRLLARLEPAP